MTDSPKRRRRNPKIATSHLDDLPFSGLCDPELLAKQPPTPSTRDGPKPVDYHACNSEGREPTPEELHAFIHAHDPPDPRSRVNPRFGRYEDLPREPDGGVHPYWFCTDREIADFGLAEPPRRHRRDNWTPQQMADFIDALASTSTVSGACACVGKSRMSAYRLRARADAGHFAAAWDAALRNVTRILADTAYERALEGVRESVWHKPVLSACLGRQSKGASKSASASATMIGC